MSFGIVVCSDCRRELHQKRGGDWYHCDDFSNRCATASTVYPEMGETPAGRYCGRDGGRVDVLRGDEIEKPRITIDNEASRRAKEAAVLSEILETRTKRKPVSKNKSKALRRRGIPGY